MDAATTIQVLGVLLILFFIFLTVMNCKSWKWFDVFFAFVLFGCTIWFAVAAAMVLKTKKVWADRAKSLQAQLDAELKKTDSLLVVSPENESDPLGTYPRAKAAAERVLIGRGRVWRSCVIAEAVTPGTMTVTMPARQPLAPVAPEPMPVPMPVDPNAPVDPNNPMPMPPPAAPAPPPEEPRPNAIRERSVLLVFREEKLSETTIVPRSFLGEWEATEVSDVNAKLKATIPLDANLSGGVQPGVMVTIYENPPTDSHVALDELFELSRAERTEDQLRAMIPKLPGVSDELYNAMISDYLRDNRDTEEGKDPPERTWVKVKFSKTKEVKVDADTEQANREARYFENGLAVLPTLRNGDGADVRFRAGDFGIFSQREAENLVNEGVCEKISFIFRRRLHDYPLHFHQHHDRYDRLVNRTEDVTRYIASLTIANQKIADPNTGIIAVLQERRTKLDGDLRHVRAEVAAITNFQKWLVDYQQAAIGRSRELFQKNQILAAKIAARQQQLTDEINKRTLQAATAAN